MKMRPDPVRGVLVEELANAESRLAMYARELNSMPRGSLVSRNIRGNQYHYVAYWGGGKVRYEYKGKMVPADIRRYVESSKMKAKYRGLMADLRARINFIKRALHERKRRAI